MVRGFTAGGMLWIELCPAIIDPLALQPSISEKPGIRPRGTSAAWNDSAGRVR